MSDFFQIHVIQSFLEQIIYVLWIIYEAFHISSPGTAREREIMLF